MKKLFVTVISFAFSMFCFAQNSVVQADRRATGLRADGKMYVVLAVAVTILIGLFIYLIRIDRKIAKLEKGERISRP